MPTAAACSMAAFWALAAVAPLDLSAQIPGVSVVCRNRPIVAGTSMGNDLPPRPARAADADAPAGPASDLFCMDLFATALAPDAAGVVELGRARSPFGVAVTPQGHHVHELTAWIARLPDPRTLGNFTAYVAWATPLELDPVQKLGVVTNGANALGQVAFNKFMILVTAEASADVAERRGPMVLRGRSPSSRMEAHDMLAVAPLVELGPGRGPDGHPADHAGPIPDWPMPPMYQGVPEMAGMANVAPTVAPLARSLFPAIETLPEAKPRQIVDLPSGGTLDLTARFVRRRIGDRDLVLMGFNGQIPGPLIRVSQASTIFVNFTNDTPFATAVHWHGLRLDNRYDGVPHVTQPPVEPGGTFRYQLDFPDAGIYWYHPHHREDIQQELGLYGNLLVQPPAPGYYGPVNREEVLMVDDLLVGNDELVPFGGESANYMLMGRFGNRFLVNGEPDYRLDVARGEVVRFFFTNVSNTRTFNLSFVAATAQGDAPPSSDVLPIKVVASDVSRFEREEIVQNIVLSPAERYIVDVRFDRPGTFALTNHVQGINHRQGVFLPEATRLGVVQVGSAPVAAEHDHGRAFDLLREHAEVVADIERYRRRFDDPPDRQLVLSLDVRDLQPAIEQSMLYDWIYFNPVEWTGTMPMMNWATTGREISWVLRDAASGRSNMDIDWRFRVGDVVKIRVTNRRDTFHAMQHPLHFHGQRFLVLSQNGVLTHNLVWKDTVLLPTGSVTDLLLELSNPGDWMVHCHIAEHLESGMKFVLHVEDR